MPKTDDDIGLKGLFVTLRDWIIYLKKKWKAIAIFSVAAGIAGFFYTQFSKPNYEAELTFVLSSNSKGSSLASLAGQFGFDVGASNDDVFAGDNIIELFKSKKIITRALFRKIPGTSITLINHLIQEENIEKNWKANSYLHETVPFPDDIKNLTPLQDSLIGELRNAVLKYLDIGKTEKNLSFYKVKAKSNSDKISFYLVNFLVDEASKFYIETKTKQAKQNLDMIQHEADSLKSLLDNTITSTAAANDQTFNMNPALQVRRAAAQQGVIKGNVVGAAYAEVIKNLELAKISLQKETPIYQIIDEPQLPLKRIKNGRLLTAIIFAIFATFLVSLFLISRYTVKKIIA